MKMNNKILSGLIALAVVVGGFGVVKAQSFEGFGGSVVIENVENFFYGSSEESLGGRVVRVQQIFTNGLISEGDIDMNAFGNRIDFDTDNDTSIRASADDTLIIEAGGSDVFTLTATSLDTSTIEVNLDTLVFGGDSTALTATTTLTAAQMCNSSYFSIVDVDDTENTAGLTTPTGAQLIADCVPTAGDTKTFMLQNTATTTFDVTVIAGSNVELVEPNAGGDVIIQQDEWAQFKFLNVDGTTVVVLVDSIRDAD